MGQEGPYFRRRDVNQDGAINIADVLAILGFLFAGDRSVDCEDAADCNDDERLNIADAIYLLQWLFAGGAPLPPPNECGPDPEGDRLGCRYAVCL